MKIRYPMPPGATPKKRRRPLSKRKQFEYRRIVTWYLSYNAETMCGMRVAYITDGVLCEPEIGKMGEENFLEQLRMMRAEGLIKVKSVLKSEEELTSLYHVGLNVILKKGFENYLMGLEEEVSKRRERFKNIICWIIIAVCALAFACCIASMATNGFGLRG